MADNPNQQGFNGPPHQGQGGPPMHPFNFPHGILPVVPPNGPQWGESVSITTTTITLQMVLSPAVLLLQLGSVPSITTITIRYP